MGSNHDRANDFFYSKKKNYGKTWAPLTSCSQGKLDRAIDTIFKVFLVENTFFHGFERDLSFGWTTSDTHYIPIREQISRVGHDKWRWPRFKKPQRKTSDVLNINIYKLCIFSWQNELFLCMFQENGNGEFLQNMNSFGNFDSGVIICGAKFLYNVD